MIKKYTLGQYKDNRGIILWASQRLLRFNYKYLTLGTMNPQSIRGGHYHKKIKEKLMCIMGVIRFNLEGEETNLNPGDIVDIPTGKIHTLYNDTKEIVAFIEFKDREFNQKKEDTYVK